MSLDQLPIQIKLNILKLVQIQTQNNNSINVSTDTSSISSLLSSSSLLSHDSSTSQYAPFNLKYNEAQIQNINNWPQNCRFLTPHMLTLLSTHGFLICDHFLSLPTDPALLSCALQESVHMLQHNEMIPTAMAAAHKQQQHISSSSSNNSSSTLSSTPRWQDAAYRSDVRRWFASASPSASASASASVSASASASQQPQQMHPDHIQYPACSAIIERMDAIRSDINLIVASQHGAQGNIYNENSNDNAQHSNEQEQKEESESSTWQPSIKTEIQIACYAGNGERYVKSASHCAICMHHMHYYHFQAY